MANEIAAKKVSLIRGWSWEEIAKLEDASIDWAYIDAGHDYDSVRKDLEAILPKMSAKGIICGHDYVKWGRFGYRCGVVEAVNSFCMENGYEMVGLTFDARIPSSFAMARQGQHS